MMRNRPRLYSLQWRKSLWLPFLCWQRCKRLSSWSINSTYHQSIPQNLTDSTFFFEEKWAKQKWKPESNKLLRKFSKLTPQTLRKFLFWKFDKLYSFYICTILHCSHLVFGTSTINPSHCAKRNSPKRKFFFSPTLRASF